MRALDTIPETKLMPWPARPPMIIFNLILFMMGRGLFKGIWKRALSGIL